MVARKHYVYKLVKATDLWKWSEFSRLKQKSKVNDVNKLLNVHYKKLKKQLKTFREQLLYFMSMCIPINFRQYYGQYLI